MMYVAVLLAAFLPAAAVSPARVPARGHQAATLTVERPGMVRLATSGGGGTACTIVDQLRGPFASSGAAGRTDCAQDLLLDAGPYRLLLDSREQGQGEVALQATLFPEVNPEPRRLEPGAPVEAELPDGKQASWWIHLDERRPVTVRVAGRTAGAVHLWRGGAWREPLEPLHSTYESLPGQPVHEWWLEGVLEPGDYLLTAYGTGALRFTGGDEHARLAVQYGFPPPAAERAVRVRLPASGAAAFATGPGRLGVVLTVTAPGPATTRLSVHPLGAAGSRMGEDEGRCEVAPRAPVPECGAWTPDGEGHVVVVHGPPGAETEVRWAPLGAAPRMVDGEYRGPERRLPLEPLAPGEWLVGLHDVPADRDAPPLGCALERQPEAGGPRELVAWDVPRLPAGQGWKRGFNYAREASLWFEVVAAGEYAISAQRASCELYRVGDDAERVDGTPKACVLQRRLSPGVYELRLRGGRDGLEEVEIGPRGVRPQEVPARAGCAVRATIAGGYRYVLLASRTGGAFARGLVARRLPLALERAVPLEVRAGETLTLPVDVRGPIRVVTPGGSPAGCWLARGGAGTWRDGACWLQASGPDELAITAKREAPLPAWIGRPVEAPPPAPPRPWRPAAFELAALAPGRPARLDLGPGEDHAFVFDVAEAGLYDVGTEGLLRTSCTLRTPALARLAEDVAGGRGRNCLVSAWLRPGRYLVSVRAEAPSQGRAGVVLGRRPARDLARIGADGELFYRVAAGELVRARLAAPAAGSFELSAAAPGAELRCRLEDAAGWPLAPVPGPCRTTLDLPAGEVVLTQLPLSVESLRRAAVSRARPPEVLRGDAPHALAFWTRYAAELGKDGQDELRFEVPAELTVSILLTNGMQGRLHREGEADPFELVPPSESSAPAAAAEDAPAAEDDAGPTSGAEAEPEPAAEVEEAAEPAADAPAASAPRHRPLATAPSARRSARAPEGFPVHLAPGRYRLVAEHARGDVAIAYEVQLSTDTLAPGMARELDVPARLPLRVPRDGTLRLRTRGEADVRCRLLDAAGRVVVESSEVGEDWNCGFAEPVTKGDYVVDVESETQLPGTSRLEVDEPAPVDAGPLADGKRYAIGPGVLAATLPPPAGDALLDVALDGPVSCALEDEAGKILFRASAPAPCRAILAPAGRPLRLRAWTLDRPAEAIARVAPRAIAALDGRIGLAQAARTEIRLSGRYRTGEGVLCATGPGAAALAACGPEVSLEAGPVVFAGLGEVRVALEELAVKVDAPAEGTIPVASRPFVQRQVARGLAVHLAEVRVAPGERAVPACALEALDVKVPLGVFATGPGACFAAAGPTESARLLLRADAPVEARVLRAAVPLAEPVRLAPGVQRLEVAPGGARLALPDGPVRADLLLPAGAWAVLLERGAARDLCAPADDLSRCTLASATGGEIVVLAADDRRLEASVATLPAPPAARTIPPSGLVEEVLAIPGTRALRVAPDGRERRLEIDGALRCALAFDDGRRTAACAATLPAGTGALVTVDHAAGPLRALVREPADALALAGGSLPASPRGVGPGEAVRLEGAQVDVSFTLVAEAAVHVDAGSGVCALVPSGAAPTLAGLGDGCRLDRVLPAGIHRVRVRAFAGRPLLGTLTVTTAPVAPLAEGVGPETWIGSGEARWFRFTVASAGKIGLGVREEAETLACTVTDGAGRVLGEGCQALLALEKGGYLLEVRAPPGAPPARFRPVLLGLAGADTGVPEDVLRELFQRIGEVP